MNMATAGRVSASSSSSAVPRTGEEVYPPEPSTSFSQCPQPTTNGPFLHDDSTQRWRWRRRREERRGNGGSSPHSKQSHQSMLLTTSPNFYSVQLLLILFICLLPLGLANQSTTTSPIPMSTLSLATTRRRAENEPCTTKEGGQCAEGLLCEATVPMLDSEEEEQPGKCVRTDSHWPERCLKAKCKIEFPKCPPDSFLVTRIPAAGECCTKPATCHCDLQRCHRLVPSCELGLERVLVDSGTNQPGSCCDKFECRKQELHCEKVKCPDSLAETYDLYSTDGRSCPEDSFRPAAYVPDGSCCPIIPECQCQAAICPPVRCSIAGEVPRIERRGDGRPGHCCDHFRCVSSTANREDEDGTFGDAPLVISTSTQCLNEDRTFNEGEHWHQDPCQICSCNGGVALCRRMECPKIPHGCNWVGIPEDECCPMCLGCKNDEGENREIGALWSKDDCTNCTCGEDFRWQCQKFICKTECDNPRKVDGECCPICDEPLIVEPPVVCASLELCSLRCEHGLLRNAWGCFECKCASASSPGDHNPDGAILSVGTADGRNCTPLTSQNCNKQCAHGYLRDHKDCPSCKCAKCPPIDQCYKHCLYGFETNSLGCSVCKCRAKSLIDARLIIQEKHVMDNNEGNCFSMSEVTRRPVERDGGEWWTDSSNCRQCFCQHRKEYCSLISCPGRPDNCPEHKWTRLKGDCCSGCIQDESMGIHPSTDQQNGERRHGLTVCHSPGNGRLFVDGETWQLSECIACTCRMGHVLCSAIECPPITCENPVKDPKNKCCLKCAGTDSSSMASSKGVYCKDEMGGNHPVGGTWRLDECTSCECNSLGVTECFRERCIQESSSMTERQCGKLLMIKGRCCPVCSNTLSNQAICTYGQNVYALGEEFRDGPCRNCRCRAGSHLECVEIQCPPCENPVPVQNQCCPSCKDPNLYLFGGGEPKTVLVANGEDNDRLNVLYVAGLAVAILFLVSCAIMVTIAWRCINSANPLCKRMTSLRADGRPSENGRLMVATALKHERRNPSECESANVSLLSSSTHSDSSRAPSTTLTNYSREFSL